MSICRTQQCAPTHMHVPLLWQGSRLHSSLAVQPCIFRTNSCRRQSCHSVLADLEREALQLKREETRLVKEIKVSACLSTFKNARTAACHIAACCTLFQSKSRST